MRVLCAQMHANKTYDAESTGPCAQHMHNTVLRAGCSGGRLE